MNKDPKTGLPINHEEAFELASIKYESSNLARCYLELKARCDMLQEQVDASTRNGESK